MQPRGGGACRNCMGDGQRCKFGRPTVFFRKGQVVAGRRTRREETEDEEAEEDEENKENEEDEDAEGEDDEDEDESPQQSPSQPLTSKLSPILYAFGHR